MAKAALLILSFLLHAFIPPSSSLTVPASAKHDTFTSNLFNKISSKNLGTNVVLSPFSIKAALTLLYMGSSGETENELRTTLQFTSMSKIENAKTISEAVNSNSGGLVQFKIANRIYTSCELNPEFNDIAMTHLNADAVMVSFADSISIVKQINSWVEAKTDNKIKDVLSPSSVDQTTTAIIVNAIYFKAAWKKQFSTIFTDKQQFWVNGLQSIDVDTMIGQMLTKYGEFADLDATAVELKYEDDDMALLVILPNNRDGLRDLVWKLSSMDFTYLTAGMGVYDVTVQLPKFKIESDIELIPILQEMGTLNAFSSFANYNELFKSVLPVKVGNVVHKAYLCVNEYGSEGAASTVASIEPRIFIDAIPKTFTADHPFVFAIKNSKAVFFIGHYLGM